MRYVYFILLPCISVCCNSVAVEDDNSTFAVGLLASLFVKGQFPRGGEIPVLNRKVFRGARVTIREHPYVVSVRRQHTHYVVGTLLTKNLVLTVAHPLHEVPTNELRVVVGENYNDRGTTLLTVVLVLLHEDFQPGTLRADLALVRIYEDIHFRVSVKPIQIVGPMKQIDGLTGFLTGWGRCDRTGKELCLPRSSRYYPGEVLDPMLRTISFTVNTTTNSCERYYPASRYVMNVGPSSGIVRDACGAARIDWTPLILRILTNGKEKPISYGMLCLGEARAEDLLCPCMAVPGAPLVVAGSLLALQSWGYGCGYANDRPLVYTSVTDYQPWIIQNIPILRNVSKQDLSELFEATKAQIICQWLFNTRMYVPVVDVPLDDIRPLAVDSKLARLAGKPYDVRDFLYSKKYRTTKKFFYAEIKRNYETFLKLKKPVPYDVLRDQPFLDGSALDGTALHVDNGVLNETEILPEDTSDEESASEFGDA